MTVQISFKQGDSFLLQGTVKIDDIVQDITNWTIKSKVKQSSTFTDTLVVTKTDAANGVYKLSKDDTTAWPSGLTPKTILCDIEYILPSGQIISTETFEILCVSGVT